MNNLDEFFFLSRLEEDRGGSSIDVVVEVTKGQIMKLKNAEDVVRNRDWSILEVAVDDRHEETETIVQLKLQGQC